MSILRPNRRKDAPKRKDPDYKSFIATLNCVVCYAKIFTCPFEEWAWGFSVGCHVYPRRPVEVAHVGNRAFGQKCSDRETMPLCKWHHTEGPEASHKLGKQFWEHHNIDRDALIELLNEFYEEGR